MEVATARRWPTRAALAVTVLAVVIGLLLRLWYLAHDPLTSDEAVVGLMARDILHGHFSAFYWGQAYGGVEPYFVVPGVLLFGDSGIAVGATAAILGALAALVTWRVLLRLVEDRRIAHLAAALSWVAPEVYLHTSTYEYGFRGVTLLAGVLALLFALRALDRRGERRLTEFAGFGLAAGIGWWASPEIVYFLVPAVLIAGGALIRRDTDRSWVEQLVPPVGVAVLAAAVGALPWIWSNAQSGLASLNATAVAAPLGYAARLRTFYRLSAPIELNMRLEGTGWELFGPHPSAAERLVADAVYVVVVVLIVLALIACIDRGGRALAIGCAVIAFPFLYAKLPATWFWEDGRYVTYLGPLVAMLLAIGVDQAGDRLASSARPHSQHRAVRVTRSAAALAMAALVLIAAGFTVVNFHRVNHVSLSTFGSHWGDPDAKNELAASELQRDGVTKGYANYWVAYDLDFFSGGKLAFTPLPNQPVRSRGIATRAGRGSGQAWLFQSPFGGPTWHSAGLFAGDLERDRLGFRFLAAGSVIAVVPRTVLPPAVGVPLSKGEGPPPPTTRA